MTTKYKIIIGFAGILLILVVVAVQGYGTLDASMSGLQEFRRLARINAGSGMALANFNEASTRANIFLGSHDPAHMKAALESLDAFDKVIDEVGKDMKRQQDLTEVDAIRKHGRTYRDGLTRVATEISGMADLYRTKVAQSKDIVVDSFGAMAQVAGENNNAAVLGLLAQIGVHGADLRHFMALLVHTRTEESAKGAMAGLEGIMTLAERMREFILPPGMATHARMLEACKVWAGAIQEMIAQSGKANAALADIRVVRAALAKELPELHAKSDELMRSTGGSIAAASLQSQQLLLAGSVAGVAVCLLLALFIIRGLVHILRETGVFARAIADGDFHAKVGAHEKGEFGEMLEDLKKIPAVLQNIVRDFHTLEQRFWDGDVLAKAEVGEYHGGFAEVIQGTNAVLDRFLHILESIPSPVLVLNKELKINYLNHIGRQLAGEDYKGKSEPQITNREDADGPNDAQKKAVQTLQPATGESVAHPQGLNVDIRYTNVPILDQKGKFVSMLQLVTDLTAVKAAQRTMVKVAEQARSIADHVASSAEELSAQVEQVSRGAAQQRDRVESTVTAMTEMNATVMEVARSAGMASEQSETTRNKATDGASVVNNVVKSMNMVNTVATTLQTNMQELGKQAESIGGVMNVISDIADQTNLLALNAAIEAARAGEAGRGFAVVADEVRKLAEKTMTATQEVGANISAIQNSAHTNIKEVEEAAKAITEATDLANTSGQALKEIVDLASANSAIVTSIATAAEEQSSTSEEINRALEDVNTLTGDTADGMRQSSQALQDLTQTAQELRRVIEEMK
ncbi:MAG: methyl-accepting chemotaxis protein [Deltaproteobacteria bacterium]|jgi:methyl-accepting chemotaxis protein|nr:methyl-accepting chemotaxis protein [Deltaproteobacteria bacterium]